MDNQNQQPIQQVETPPTQSAAPNPDKPKLKISDEEARALLAINNLQSAQLQNKRTRVPITLLITLVTVVVLVIVAGVVASNFKPKTTQKTSSTSSSSSNSSEENDSTTNQIGQDANSCSNPLTAVSQC